MTPTADIDVLWTLICAGLVFIMQAGFLGLEAGLTRSKNSVNVAMKNMVDFGLAVVLFYLFGFFIMFGHPPGTEDSGLLGVALQDRGTTTFFLFQMMFCGATVTIISGAVAERMRFSAYLIMTLLVAGIVYPLHGQWVWGGAIGNPEGWLAVRGYRDFAGSSVVHTIGGWVALAGVMILGPRDGRFEEGRTRALPGHNLPLAAFGVLIIWFGWIGFNGGSNLALDGDVPRIIVNTIVSAAGGLVAGLFLGWLHEQFVNPFRVMNGALAGLVSITACAHAVRPGQAFVIGAIGTVVAYIADLWMIRRKLDDAVGAVPVHLFAGLWAIIAVAVFGDLEMLGTGLSRLEQLSIQGLGLVVGAAWAFGIAYPVLKLVNLVVPFRVSKEAEQEGLNVHEHRYSSELTDLLELMEEQADSGNLSMRADVDPFTEVGQIARRYNTVIGALEAAAERLQSSNKRLESEITKRTEAQQFSREREARLRAILDHAQEAIVTTDVDGAILSFNLAAESVFGRKSEEVLGQNVAALFGEDRWTTAPKDWPPAFRESLNEFRAVEVEAFRSDDSRFPVSASISSLEVGSGEVFTLILRDLSEERALQAQLNQAQKLEAIGQLAAGVAHEINTPTQYVGDNLRFLKESFTDLFAIVEALRPNAAGDEPPTSPAEILEKHDIEFLADEIPEALDQALEGVSRVSEIVGAMKEFSHPGTGEATMEDLNSAVSSTITVARNSWRYVADLETEFDPDLPMVPCLLGEFNQVILNLIVNAADAISDRIDKGEIESGGKGWIRISTAHVDDMVEVRVVDSGGGIPAAVVDRVFDPFFTTKEVGKGTGQGLAICHNVIVEKHGGTVDLETEEGVGTTFILRIPTQAHGAAAVAEDTTSEAVSDPTGAVASES